jgi:secernin
MITPSCDTLVALSSATADGSVVLAKNSDRKAEESQPLIQVSRQKHSPGSPLRCQYIEIPQAEETLGFIGSRPYWLWGLEHGMNECGVAIGNEAVFTKGELSHKGLLGMDLVRLGLERGHTAKEAVEVITGLLKEFGQGGPEHQHAKMPYSTNSFIIADSSEAYILETSGRQYAWKKVTDVGSISNHVLIGEDWDALSDDAIDFAIANGWWEEKAEKRLDFAGAYRSIEMVPPQISEERLRQSQMLLEECRGKISPATMMRALRDHYESGTIFTQGGDFAGGKSLTICCHAEPVGTTAASMVAHLRGDSGPKVYWASFGTPCCGVFMPLYIEGEIPETLTRAGSAFSEDSVWWLFKKLGERVAEDYAERTPHVQKVWFELETEFFEKAVAVEKEVRDLQGNGDGEAAARLSQFMQDNLDTVLMRLRELTAELA